MKTIKKTLKNKSFILLGFVFCLVSVQLSLGQKAQAAYEAGNILDNNVLLDATSMSPGDIQTFLNNRGGQIASRSFSMDCDAAGQQAKNIYLSLGAPCGQVTSSANIIYYVAQVYGISPKVIMATMQKEQSLITATNPTNRQYNQAMGYACPTSGSCDDGSNFFWQIDNGTWVLRYHFERARGNMNWWRPSTSWTCGTEKNLYKPNLYPGQNVNFFDTNGVHYATIYIQNAATSSFYCYTPHAYNNPQGLYGRSPYGTTGLYYSGSYNFVTFYELWWGSTKLIANFEKMTTSRHLKPKNNEVRKINLATGEETGGTLNTDQYIYFTGRTLYRGHWCLRTQLDRDNSNKYCIPFSDLSEIDITYSPSDENNIRIMGNQSRKHNPITQTNLPLLSSGQIIPVTQKFTFKGVEYYRTKLDESTNATYGIRKDQTQAVSINFSTIQNTKLYINASSASKLDLWSMSPASSLRGLSYQQEISFVATVNVGGTAYYVSEVDYNSGNPRYVVRASLLTSNKYSAFDTPRNMRVTARTCKFDLISNTESQICYNPGQILYFDSKITVSGKLWYRSSWETRYNTGLVIDPVNLSEI